MGVGVNDVVNIAGMIFFATGKEVLIENGDIPKEHRTDTDNGELLSTEQVRLY